MQPPRCRAGHDQILGKGQVPRVRAGADALPHCGVSANGRQHQRERHGQDVRLVLGLLRRLVARLRLRPRLRPRPWPPAPLRQACTASLRRSREVQPRCPMRLTPPPDSILVVQVQADGQRLRRVHPNPQPLRARLRLLVGHLIVLRETRLCFPPGHPNALLHLLHCGGDVPKGYALGSVEAFRVTVRVLDVGSCPRHVRRAKASSFETLREPADCHVAPPPRATWHAS
mmetsp:Transcript_15571/g.47462  ORF Transcript_15571/g.47462 Transcript_15571/m.47462 type:complete len:229 (-) Transcript_15571:3015-3701(-)